AVLRPRIATVEFVSEPSGAEVTLSRGNEHRALGTTPTRAELDIAGSKWMIHMSRRGYQSWSQLLEPSTQGTKTAVHAYLEPRARRSQAEPRGAIEPQPYAGPKVPEAPTLKASAEPGILQINTTPWSQVYVDGRLVGSPPQMSIPLEP